MVKGRKVTKGTEGTVAYIRDGDVLLKPHDKWQDRKADGVWVRCDHLKHCEIFTTMNKALVECIHLLVKEAKRSPKQQKPRSYLPLRTDSQARRFAKGDAYKMRTYDRKPPQPYITYEQAQSALDNAVREFSLSFEGGYDEDPDCDNLIPDAALNFFATYPDWERWAQKLGLSRNEVLDYVKDFISDAMHR